MGARTYPSRIRPPRPRRGGFSSGRQAQGRGCLLSDPTRRGNRALLRASAGDRRRRAACSFRATEAHGKELFVWGMPLHNGVARGRSRSRGLGAAGTGRPGRGESVDIPASASDEEERPNSPVASPLLCAIRGCRAFRSERQSCKFSLCLDGAIRWTAGSLLAWIHLRLSAPAQTPDQTIPGVDSVRVCTDSWSCIRRPPTRITSGATTRTPTSSWRRKSPGCGAIAMASTSFRRGRVAVLLRVRG